MADGLTMDDYRRGVESGKFPQPMHTDGGRPPGWFRGEQGKVYAREAARVKRGRVVEVGCYFGRSLSWVAPICIANHSNLFAVDPWENCPRSEFERYMREYGWLDHICIIQLKSVDAALLFVDESVGLCMIDAWHDRDSVAADIEAWWPKIKRGGVLMGHDYEQENYGVREAVDERFGPRVQVAAGMWMVDK